METGTAGEIAVIVVDQSDTYPEGQILAGTVIGSLLALITADFFFAGSLWAFVPMALGLAVLCGWLSNYLPAVKRFFTPDARFDIQVEDRALTSFYDKGLYKTRDQTGVLFFISLFEHKVWVLADKGIYEKIKQETLQKYAHDVALGIKTGKAAEALCSEIRSVGKILAEHFPIKPEDINELSNEVIVG